MGKGKHEVYFFQLTSIVGELIAAITEENIYSVELLEEHGALHAFKVTTPKANGNVACVNTVAQTINLFPLGTDSIAALRGIGVSSSWSYKEKNSGVGMQFEPKEVKPQIV